MKAAKDTTHATLHGTAWHGMHTCSRPHTTDTCDQRVARQSTRSADLRRSSPQPCACATRLRAHRPTPAPAASAAARRLPRQPKSADRRRTVGAPVRVACCRGCVRLAAIQCVCAWLRSNTTQYSRASLPVAVRVARFTARGDEAFLVCCMLSALRPVCYTKHVRSRAPSAVCSVDEAQCKSTFCICAFVFASVRNLRRTATESDAPPLVDGRRRQEEPERHRTKEQNDHATRTLHQCHVLASPA